jgi:hypothetical protein
VGYRYAAHPTPEADEGEQTENFDSARGWSGFIAACLCVSQTNDRNQCVVRYYQWAIRHMVVCEIVNIVTSTWYILTKYNPLHYQYDMIGSIQLSTPFIF